MEHTSKRPDLRVIKTKRAIRCAFAELLSEKDIDRITVKDIASRALINRKTFYNYYRGVYQIVDEIEGEISASFDNAVREAELKKDARDPYTVFQKLTEVIKGDIDFYGALLKMNGNAGLAEKIKIMLRDKVQQVFSGTTDIPPDRLSVMMDFAVSGMLSVYRSWCCSDRKLSIDEVSDIVSRMCIAGITGTVGDGTSEKK